MISSELSSSVKSKLGRGPCREATSSSVMTFFARGSLVLAALALFAISASDLVPCVAWLEEVCSCCPSVRGRTDRSSSAIKEPGIPRHRNSCGCGFRSRIAVYEPMRMHRLPPGFAL